MPSGSSNLQCPFDIFLPLYICKIYFKIILCIVKFFSCIYNYRLQTGFVVFKKINHFIYMCYTKYLQVIYHTGFF